MRRRTYMIVAAGIVAAAGLWTAGWFWFASMIESNLAHIAEERREAGVIFAWNPMSIAGFPFRFDLTLGNPSIVWLYEARRIAWDGADLRFRMFADEPRQATYRAPGKHTVVIEQDGTALEFLLEFARLQGIVALEEASRGRRFTMAFDNSSVTGDVLGTPLTIDRGAIDWMRTEDLPYDAGAVHPQGVRQRFAAQLQNLRLPPGLVDEAARNALGETISRLAMDLRLRGDLEPGGLAPETLAAWRDAGGTLEVDVFEIVWGPLAISGSGTLAVDPDLQPEGAFTAKIAGLAELIDALQQAGSISPRDAAVARISLAVLTRAQPDGAPPAAEVPVSVQDRVLSLGPVPLVRLPRITWEQTQP